MAPSRQIACAANHAVVATDKGTVFGWGSTEQGQFGEPKAKSKLFATECTTVLELQPRGINRPSETPDNGISVECVGCEDRATVIVHRNGYLEEWRDGRKNIVWGLETPVLGTWVPRAAQVSCGGSHSLVIDELGRLWSWGSNMHGELGLGDMQDRTVPSLISVLEKITVVRAAAGGKHSLCCTKDGDVYAFGYNERGQLGTGSQAGQASPTLVNALQKTIRDVACGASHSAALSEEGRLYIWGAGSYGRCGHGYEGDGYYPLENETLAKIGRVAMCSLGELHSACVMDTGRLFVWGSGMYNKLGLGEDTENKLFPIELKSQLGLFSAVACGAAYTLAVTKDGQVVSWGSPSSTGRLGRSLSSDCSRPYFVEGIPKEETIGVFSAMDSDGQATSKDPVPSTIMRSHLVKQIAVGNFHSLLLTNGGVVFSFGSNVYGQCGISGHAAEQHQRAGSTATSADVSAIKVSESDYIKTPRQVHVSDGTASHKISFVACGASHSLIITVKGGLLTFGNGNSHQLGLGMISNKFSPTVVNALAGNRVEFVAGGENHSACITREGSLYTWGASDSGKLGLGRNVEALVSLPSLVHIPLELGDRVISVSCASAHTLVVTKKGKLFAFGAGFYGRLGTGRVRNELDPVPVSFEGEEVIVSDASAGDLHSVCVSASGDLYVWGIGDARLGLGDTSDKLVPTKNSKFPNPCIHAVAADTHTLVMTVDGAVWAFGKNSYGKLGLGTDPRDCVSPEQIKPEIMQLGAAPDSSLEQDIRSVSTRANHSLALSRDGRVYAWGAAGQGRLGLPSMSGVAEVVSPRRLDELDTVDDSALSAGTAQPSSILLSSSSATEVVALLIADFKTSTANNVPFDERNLTGTVVQPQPKPDVIPPLGAIQFYVKAKQKPQYSDQSLKQQLKACFDWEAVNLHSLRQFVLRQGELNNLEMTIAFAVEHVAAAVAKRSFFPITRTPQSVLKNVSKTVTAGSSRSNTAGAKRRRSKKPSDTVSTTGHDESHVAAKTDGEGEEGQAVVTQHLLASLPFLERVLSLLLINPGHVYGFYERLVVGKGSFVTDRSDVRWSDLFVGLCRDLYCLQDPHCERLFQRLCISVAQDEIDNAKNFSIYCADFQRKSVFRRLFELFLLNQPKLSSLIKRRLRAEFIPFVKNIQVNEAVLRSAALVAGSAGLDKEKDGTSEKAMRDLSEIAVKVFNAFEAIISEAIFQDFQGLGQVCYNYYSLLISKFFTPALGTPSNGNSGGLKIGLAMGKGAAAAAAAAAERPRQGTIMDDRDLQNHIALFVARFLYQTIFDPVLREPSKFGLDDPLEASADDDFPEVSTRDAISKFLMHSMTMPVSGESATTSSFEASVAAYQNYVRGAFETRQRMEMDAKLVEARSNFGKQKDFELRVEEKRLQMMRDAARSTTQAEVPPAWVKWMDGVHSGGPTSVISNDGWMANLRAMDDVLRPMRELSVKLIRQELKRMACLSLEIESLDMESLDVAQLSALAGDTLDINLMIDLAKEHLRLAKDSIEQGFDPSLNRPLVIYPTRRTLEFIKFIIFPTLKESVEDMDEVPQMNQAEPINMDGGAVARVAQNAKSDSVKARGGSRTTTSDTSDNGKDVVFSSQGEWQVLQELVMDYEREFGENFRLKNFEMKVQDLNDTWGIAIQLDLRRLELNVAGSSLARIISSKADTFDRLYNLTRLDGRTRTPIPVQLVRDRDLQGDVLGLERMAETANVDVIDFRDVLSALPQLPLEEVTPVELSAVIAQEANKRDSIEAFRRLRDKFPGGEELVRLCRHVLEEAEFRERAIAKLSALRRAHESLKEHIDSTMHALEEIAGGLQSYALVLRDRDTSRNHEQVQEISRRKGRAFKLTELDFIRAIQLKGVLQGNTTSAPRSSFSLVKRCFIGDPDDQLDAILERKRQLSAHNLVRGAFLTHRYQELKDLDVILDIPSGQFGMLHPGSPCPSANVRTAVLGDCSLSDDQLRKNWGRISKRLVFNFFLTDAGRFTISIVYNAVTVIALVEDHISSLLTRSRSFSLEWHPDPRFPVKFRVHKLLSFIQEMSLQSFM